MTYSNNLPKGFEGQHQNSELSLMVSAAVETEAGIAFGKPVVRGNADKSCRAIAAGDTAVFGVTVRTASVRTADKFSQREDARIMRKGVIFVKASVAVEAGQPVYVVPATGAFTNVSSGNVAMANTEFDTSGAADSLVKIRMA